MWKKSMDAEVQPIDDGCLSEKHAAHARSATPNVQRPTLNVQRSNGASAALAPKTAARIRPVSPGYATGMRRQWHHHARDGIHRDSRESRARTASAGSPHSAPRSTNRDFKSAQSISHFRHRRLRTNRRNCNRQLQIRSLLNSCARKSRAVAPSFPQTSIIPNPSR